jgi:hypothetical protein
MPRHQPVGKQLTDKSLSRWLIRGTLNVPTAQLGVRVMVMIGTWNLENLFRPGGASGPRTQAGYDAKLVTLAATITRLTPDVLAVQEVGQSEALVDLVALLAGPWQIQEGDGPH